MQSQLRKNGNALSKKEVRKNELLLGFHNKVHNTSYNLDSINVKTVISHHGFNSNKSHFVYTVSNENNNIITTR